MSTRSGVPEDAQVTIPSSPSPPPSAPVPTAGTKSWTAFHTSSLLVLLAGMLVVGYFMTSPLWAWLVVMLLLALSVVVAGHGIRRLWRGVLIDERQQLSLSRLQLLLWTVLVLGGYLAAALANLRSGTEDPLAIAIPPELWAALGISITSLVGSPLIRKPKKDRAEDKEEFQRTKERAIAQGIPGAATVVNEGQVVEKADPRDSGFGDMFRGEETGNWASLDLGKLQMFYFTAIIVSVYAFALGAILADAGGQPITEFPEVEQSFVALLGISHAGYLSFKAVPHSGTAS
jgi:hypothetical protein